MNNWIKCSDKLPDKNRKYLACSNEEDIFIDYFTLGEWSLDKLHDSLKVIYWMPLPEPPRDVDE